MTQEEKIKDLEQCLASKDANNSALAADLKHWKKVAAGLKGLNKQLAERVAHYKALDLEGDRLYEDKISELDEARKEIELLRQARNDVVPKKDYDELEKLLQGKSSFIEQMQERLQLVMIEKSEIKGKLSTQMGIVKELEETVCELSKPWWKRIF